jgi:SUKH-4 immunity protein
LVIAGLPESAAPFLSFEGSEQGGGKPLNEKYEVSENEFKEFTYIGFTGENNPICISTTSGTVVSFDYQNNFDEIFINSSINQLAESLLIYDDFVKKLN